MKQISTLSRTVFKATGLFGGTQVAQLIGSALRTKLIAIWVGEMGIGLFGILNTAVDMIGALTQLGLRGSAVRDVSELVESGDKPMLARLVKAVRRWGWALGMLGLLVMAIAAPLLAMSAFGTPSTVWPFLLLALVMLLNSATEAERAVMQGERRYSLLARVTLWSVVIGCAVSIPMIYVWRINCVAPVILAYSAVSYMIIRCARAPQPPAGRQSIAESIALGKRFMKLGFFLTISAVMSYLASYLFLTYMNLTAGTDTVGEYQAGYTLSVKYVGFLFTAIGVEYYPRLAGAAVHGLQRVKVFMRHEAKLLTLMITIAAVAMASMAPLIVEIFYTSAFSDTINLVILASPGLVLRAASWCVAFVILVRGDGRLYFGCELASNLIGLALNVIAFRYWGVAGVGASFTLWYVIYLAIVGCTVMRRYDITLGSDVAAMVLCCFVGVCATSALALWQGVWVSLGFALFVVLGCLILLLGRGGRRRRRA